MTNTVRDHLRALAFLEGLTDTAVHQLSKIVQPVEYACDLHRGDRARFVKEIQPGDTIGSYAERMANKLSGHLTCEGSPEDIVNDPDVRRLYLGEEFRL